MSNLSRVTNEEVIDLTAPQTPPPNQRSKDGPGSAQLSSLASPNASFYSPPPGQHTGEEGSAYNNPSAASQNQQGAGAARWSSQTVYLRVMGRKAGTANNELSLAKPFKATPLNYSLMGLFSKESNEVSAVFKFSITLQYFSTPYKLTEPTRLSTHSFTHTGATNPTHAEELQEHAGCRAAALLEGLGAPQEASRGPVRGVRGA